MNEKRLPYGLIIAVLLATLPQQIPAVHRLLGLSPINPIPLIWCAIALALYCFLPRVHSPGHLRTRNQVWGAAVSGATILLALLYGAGVLLHSIAATPYDLSPSGIILNLWHVVPALIGLEMVRAYTLGLAYRNPHSRIWIPIIVIVLCLLEIDGSQRITLTDAESWFIFIVRDTLPLLTEGCLLAVLVLCGGAAASILYSACVSVFSYIFPFLPSLPWIAESTINITYPAIMALLIWNWHRPFSPTRIIHRQENLGLFTVALIVSVSFAWFVVGVFPIYPSVVLTGSMEPDILPGDAVLIKKFSSEAEIYNLAEGDVINFNREDITISHRIIAVLYDAVGNVSFQTKGDNNNAVDALPVLPKDLNGVIRGVVPKVGLPVLWLRSGSPLPEGVLSIEVS